MFMDSIKIIAFKNIQRCSMTIPVEVTIKCSSCFYTILHVLIIAKYMIKIHFTYPSRWMLFLQALCMHPCHEEHRGQTKPSGLNWNKIINQIKSTYINIYAVCREGIFISLSIHLRLILTEACDNYDVHAHDGTRPLLGPHLRLSWKSFIQPIDLFTYLLRKDFICSLQWSR